MLGRENQQKIEHNIRRVQMFAALRRLRALVQTAEEEEKIEQVATKVAVAFLAVGLLILIGVQLANRHGLPSAPSVQISSIDASPSRFAPYIDTLVQQIQRQARLSCTNMLSPSTPRATLHVRMVIRSNGTLESVSVRSSSGIKAVDDAAIRAVVDAAPFPSFPPAIKQDADILDITRTFIYNYEPCDAS